MPGLRCASDSQRMRPLHLFADFGQEVNYFHEVVFRIHSAVCIAAPLKPETSSPKHRKLLRRTDRRGRLLHEIPLFAEAAVHRVEPRNAEDEARRKQAERGEAKRKALKDHMESSSAPTCGAGRPSPRRDGFGNHRDRVLGAEDPAAAPEHPGDRIVLVGRREQDHPDEGAPANDVRDRVFRFPRRPPRCRQVNFRPESRARSMIGARTFDAQTASPRSSRRRRQRGLPRPARPDSPAVHLPEQLTGRLPRARQQIAFGSAERSERRERSGRPQPFAAPGEGRPETSCSGRIAKSNGSVPRTDGAHDRRTFAPSARPTASVNGAAELPSRAPECRRPRAPARPSSPPQGSGDPQAGRPLPHARAIGSIRPADACRSSRAATFISKTVSSPER